MRGANKKTKEKFTRRSQKIRLNRYLMASADIMPVVSVTAIIEVTPLLTFVRLLLQAILNSSNVLKIRLKM